MSSRDHLKGVPMSDAWLQKFSDDSDSADRSMEFIKRPKAKHDWTISRGRHRSDILYDNQDLSTTPESDVLDDDDADDEDWIAYDHDKKRRSGRPMRPTHRSQGGTIQRQSHQRDRSRAKLGSSSQSHLTAQSARTARHPPSRQKLHSGSIGGHGTRRQGQNTNRGSPIDNSRPVQLPDELSKPRQCFGPGCTRAAARPDTKYCSDECGIKLALRRIEVLLPENLTAMNRSLNCNKTYRQSDFVTPNMDRPHFVAEQLDKARLEEIQIEKCTVRDRLIQLETEHQQLDALIVRARKHAPPSSNQVTSSPTPKLAEVAKDAEQVEQMEPVVCVTCASEVSMRHALRHMEKCFQKMEGNTVFCANQKEQIMGTPLFCDAYDTQAKAYCKRLKVVCEHFKEPKLPPDTVCGFPFVRDVFVETGDFCCVPRSRCNRHLGWERLRRAQIDLERYRYFIRMDELLQEEQRVQQSIAQRGGLLGMLLHKTVDHKPTVQVPIPSDSKAKTTMD